MTSIGSSAFYGCTSLSKVTVLNPTPVSITKDYFSDYDAFSSTPASATLYVPSAEAATAYSNSDWANYFTIDVLTGTDKLNADKASDDGAFYDLNGRKMMSKPVRGLYIRNGKKYMNTVR